MNNEAERLVTELQGWIDLELYEDAWERIEEASPEIRTHPAILRARMVCAFGLMHLEMAEELARFLVNGDPAEARVAAKVLQELAACHVIAGNVERAREMVKVAINGYPEQRLAILDDPSLGALF